MYSVLACELEHPRLAALGNIVGVKTTGSLLDILLADSVKFTTRTKTLNFKHTRPWSTWC